MKYTVVLTENTDGNYQAAVPGTQDLQVDTPWEYFGNFKDNQAWETVFDEIHRQHGPILVTPFFSSHP